MSKGVLAEPSPPSGRQPRRGTLAAVWSLVSAVAAAAVLSGCTAFSRNADPVSTYTLSVSNNPGVPFDGTPCCVLEVRTPLPAPGFATVRMVYQRSDYQYEAFAYAQWVDTLPGLLRSIIIQHLDDLGRFEMVVAAPSPEAPKYRIETRDVLVVQRFAADGASSEVEVSFRARVIDADARQLLGARQFVATVGAAPTPEGGVAAANAALAEVMDDLSRYLLEVLGS